ncbi:MAG: AAA family ATPase [Planctomycetes bacterium]|nr:AAA family ATPase [Planctomycetota bacterium]
MKARKSAKAPSLFGAGTVGPESGKGSRSGAKRGSERLRFTSLRLENWRNFTSVDVSLRSRVFLVGPNAAGKSNLQDAFRFLHDVVAVGGGFQAAIENKRGGIGGLRCLAARQHSDIRIDVGIGTDQEPDVWRYSLVINQNNQRQPEIRSERVEQRGVELLARPDADDREDPKRLTQTHLEQINVNREFREIADFFASVRYFHVVPQLVREPDRSAGLTKDPFGGDLIEQIASTPNRIQNSRLKKIEDALRVAVPQLRQLEVEKDARGVPHLRGKYQHWRPQGAWQREDQFSDGTLRLLGLLWALLDGTGPLLLEEPELSLHPEVIRHLPQMFSRMQRTSGRQIVVSTHSPDLLVDPGIGLDEVLLLQPGENGTVVRSTQDFEDIANLVVNGVPLPEAILPHTRPENVSQLVLFSDDRAGGPGS